MGQVTLEDIDIYRIAKTMIKAHGEAALVEAMGKVQEFTDKSNPEASSMWNRVANAIEFYQCEAITPDVSQH